MATHRDRLASTIDLYEGLHRNAPDERDRARSRSPPGRDRGRTLRADDTRGGGDEGSGDARDRAHSGAAEEVAGGQGGGETAGASTGTGTGTEDRADGSDLAAADPLSGVDPSMASSRDDLLEGPADAAELGAAESPAAIARTGAAAARSSPAGSFADGAPEDGAPEDGAPEDGAASGGGRIGAGLGVSRGPAVGTKLAGGAMGGRPFVTPWAGLRGRPFLLIFFRV